MRTEASVGAPSASNGSGIRCERCGTESPPGSNQCVRCGRFIRANAAAVTHGVDRYRATGVLPPDLRVSVDEFRDGLISDQGGLDNLTTVRAGLCRLLVDCEVGRRLLMDEVVRRGIASRPGRAAYDRLLATMDRWHKFAGTLGVERRAKYVDPLDAVRAAVARANQREKTT